MTNHGTIAGGTFLSDVTNRGVIEGGIFENVISDQGGTVILVRVSAAREPDRAVHCRGTQRNAEESRLQASRAEPSAR